MESQGRPPGIRQRRRAEIEAALLEAGRSELRRVGAAALSVRAVARELGMAPSALFRYIEGRDDLLTMLIVAAYDDLGTRVEAAEGAVDRVDLRGRWRALAGALRDWARTHPHEWALLYGSPVPDYHAPSERTDAAGQRVSRLLIRLGLDAQALGRPPRVCDAAIAALAAEATAPVRDAGPELAPAWFAAGTLAWTSLLGLVSAEIFEALGPGMAGNEAWFAYGVRTLEELLFGPE